MSLLNDTVCVVSYAKYMKDLKMGAEIDSYDKVVRINNGINISSDDVSDFGKKTNILACSFCGGKNNFIVKTYNHLRKSKEKIDIFDLIKSYNVKDIFICKSKAGNIEESATKHELNVLIPTNKHIEWAVTTGLQAIINVLKLKPKKLFLTGFSFTMELHPSYEKYYLMFKGEKIRESLDKNYDVDPNCKHSTIFEKYIMKKLVKRYKILVDKNMKRIISNFDLSGLNNKFNEKIAKTYNEAYNEIINFIDN